MVMKRKLLCHIAWVCSGMLAAIALAASAEAQAQQAATRDNLASGKQVEFAPNPNYPLSTDEHDSVQLTDGKLSSRSQRMWTQREAAVGWQRVGHIIITLDLGKVEPISGVGVHSGAGIAGGVHWATRIQVLVSDDGKTYYDVGDLLDVSTPPKRTAPFHYHWFRSRALKTHGRYVKLLIEPGGVYFFTDQVEVYRGQSSWLDLPHSGRAITNIEDYPRQLLVDIASQRRLNQDMRSVEERVSASTLNQADKQTLLGQVQALRQTMRRDPASSAPSGNDTILPLNPLHQQIMAVWGRFLAASGAPPLVAHPANLWDYMDWISQPAVSAEDNAVVALWAMRHEIRSAAVNLTNATGQQMEVGLRVQGLDAHAGLQDVHAVTWTDTAEGEPIATALIELKPENERYTVTIPAGVTRQVWVTFKPTAAGRFAGHIVAQVDGHTSRIPLQVNVFNLAYPDRQHLHIGGWDYTNRLKENEVTASNREALLKLLQSYGVDTPWGTRLALPWGKYDKDGNMTHQPDMSNFDAWLELWPNAARYAVYRSVGDRLDNIPVGTPAFTNAAQQWARFIARHAVGKGLRPEQILIHLIDEPRSSERYELATTWAEAIRSGESGVTLWINPTPHDLGELPAGFLSSYDIFCWHRVRILGAWQKSLAFSRQLIGNGKSVEIYYGKGLMKQRDPYGYVRLQGWMAWKLGANASYFWSFTDNGAVSDWQGYAPRPVHKSYSPIFMDDESATASKQLAALRASVQDYEYLWMLRDAMQRSTSAGLDPDLLRQGQMLMDSAVDRVLKSAGIGENYDVDKAYDMTWSHPKDRDMADQVRIAIGQWLQAVQGDAE